MRCCAMGSRAACMSHQKLFSFALSGSADSKTQLECWCSCSPLASMVRLATRFVHPSTSHALGMHGPGDDPPCTASKQNKRPGCPAHCSKDQTPGRARHRWLPLPPALPPRLDHVCISLAGVSCQPPARHAPGCAAQPPPSRAPLPSSRMQAHPPGLQSPRMPGLLPGSACSRWSGS
jgi:hypothetical protein